jgi:hypothetical protein
VYTAFNGILTEKQIMSTKKLSQNVQIYLASGRTKFHNREKKIGYFLVLRMSPEEPQNPHEDLAISP